MPFTATWMDRENVKLSEVSQNTERQILCDVSYFGILKKNDRNELIYETETDSFHLENEL